MIITTGCQSTYNVRLKTKIEYEKSNIDVCQYIVKIDNTKIREFNRSANKIEEGDYHVACPEYNVTKLGKQEVTISINSVDVILNFEIKDTVAPTIILDKDNLSVEKGNEYFDLKKLVTVSDLYDKAPIIGYSGDYDINIPGKYSVTISAKDCNENSSRKEVSVIVAEKEIQIIEKEVIVKEENPSSNGTSSPPAPIVQSNSPALAGLPSKSFLFSDGFDLNTGFQSCKTYRGQSAGSCSPLIDSNNITYGYIYNP